MRFVRMFNLTGDILLAVYGETSRAAGGIFAGLRHDLFSRVKCLALAVEQVCRWLCHTAGTPMLARKVKIIQRSVDISRCDE